MSNADLLPVAGARRRRRMGVSLLAAALAVCMLPGVAEAAKKKSKPDRVKVGTYNLYLGSSLDAAVAAGVAGRTDAFINEVGKIVADVNTNDFPLRAKAIAARINKKKLDLVGLQEAALWRQSIPTDGAAPPLGPGQPAVGVVQDYVNTLLSELNRKARTAKQCKKAARKAKSNGKKPKPCYRGYRLVIDQQEANVESLADLDDNPGPDGKTADITDPATPPPPADNWTWGNDDTGLGLGEPPTPPFPGDANGDNGGATDVDCQDSNPATGALYGNVGNWGGMFVNVCLFHGVDADVRLTMRDAILARKGAGVGTSDPKGANYTTKFSVPVFGASLDFLRGWTSTEANVRGKKFHFVNTHLESESNAARTAQAGELVAPGGPATASPTVLVGDLNSDPNGASPDAYNVLAAAGFQSRTGPGLTFGHGKVLTDSSNVIDNSRIDHILTNSSRITLAGSSVFDVFRNGLWASDHGGVESRLNVPGKQKKKKKSKKKK